MRIELPAEPLHVDGDIMRLSQVIANLLTNAAKYTDEGGEIALTAHRNDGGIAITVRDNGMGIRADVLPHVFDLFMQSERALARSQGGLGIGLTLVHRLVETHGGQVTAKSEGPGKGSEFTVWLPAAHPTEAELAEPAALEQPERNAHKYRILVVDDNIDAGESLRLLLQSDGHDVRNAQDGEVAIEMARDFKPQLVLLDLGMPKMDGYAIIRRLRAEAGSEQPLIAALTGYGHEEERKRTQNAGFDRHLVKPVGFAELSAVVASLAGGAS